jgi:hypothetical protein
MSESLSEYLSDGKIIDQISCGYKSYYPCIVWSPELDTGAIISRSIDSKVYTYELYTIECDDNILGFTYMIYSKSMSTDIARDMMNDQIKTIGLTFAYAKKRYYIKHITRI